MGNDFQYTFDRYNERYRLDAGLLPVGDYKFKAIVTIGDMEYIEEGNFAITPVNIEAVEKQANHNLLYQISNSTNGQLFGSNEANDLVEAIYNDTSIKTTGYTQTTFANVLNI